MGNSCTLCLGFRKPLNISSGLVPSTPDRIPSPRGLQGEVEVEDKVFLSFMVRQIGDGIKNKDSETSKKICAYRSESFIHFECPCFIVEQPLQTCWKTLHSSIYDLFKAPQLLPAIEDGCLVEVFPDYRACLIVPAMPAVYFRVPIVLQAQGFQGSFDSKQGCAQNRFSRLFIINDTWRFRICVNKYFPILQFPAVILAIEDGDVHPKVPASHTVARALHPARVKVFHRHRLAPGREGLLDFRSLPRGGGVHCQSKRLSRLRERGSACIRGDICWVRRLGFSLIRSYPFRASSLKQEVFM